MIKHEFDIEKMLADVERRVDAIDMSPMPAKKTSSKKSTNPVDRKMTNTKCVPTPVAELSQSPKPSKPTQPVQAVIDENVRTVNQEVSPKVENAENTQLEESNESNKKPNTSKQRKKDLEAYRNTFLVVPKITNRRTVFISHHLREKIVEIIRKLGYEKSSVSGFLENLVIDHLEVYREETERWKKL